MKLFGKDEEASLAKAVINHSKELVQEVKPTINNYINKHSKSNSDINDDEIYEEVMVEIEEDNKIKSTWAKALSQSDGDDKKAQSLYIKLRVDTLIQEKKIFIENEKKIVENQEFLLRQVQNRLEEEKSREGNVDQEKLEEERRNHRSKENERIDNYIKKSNLITGIIFIIFIISVLLLAIIN